MMSEKGLDRYLNKLSWNKPMNVLARVAIVYLFFHWLEIGLEIVKAHSVAEIANKEPRSLIWVVGNTLFLYLYLRNKLIAWHVEVVTVIATCLLAWLNTWPDRKSEPERLLAICGFAVVFLVYLFTRYDAYARYVEDLTADEGLE